MSSLSVVHAETEVHAAMTVRQVHVVTSAVRTEAHAVMTEVREVHAATAAMLLSSTARTTILRCSNNKIYTSRKEGTAEKPFPLLYLEDPVFIRQDASNILTLFAAAHSYHSSDNSLTISGYSIERSYSSVLSSLISYSSHSPSLG